jgi:hypothetical protein
VNTPQTRLAESPDGKIAHQVRSIAIRDPEPGRSYLWLLALGTNLAISVILLVRPAPAPVAP